jgi:hypothetical protein
VETGTGTGKGSVGVDKKRVHKAEKKLLHLVGKAILVPPWKQPRGKKMVSVVNSH